MSCRQNKGRGLECDAIQSEGTLRLKSMFEGNFVWSDATKFVYFLVLKAEGMCDDSNGIPDGMRVTDVCYCFY